MIQNRERSARGAHLKSNAKGRRMGGELTKGFTAMGGDWGTRLRLCQQFTLRTHEGEWVLDREMEHVPYWSSKDSQQETHIG